MYKSKMRLLGVSALVGAGLMAAGPAGAAEVSLGKLNISIDTTMSVGASWLTEQRAANKMAANNGGRPEQGRAIPQIYGTTNFSGPSADEFDGEWYGYLGLTSANEDALAAGATDAEEQAASLADLAVNMPIGAAAFAGCGVGVSLESTVGAAGKANNALCVFDESAHINSQYGYNRGGSANADDRRINFDEGDMIGGTLKFVSDISTRMGKWSGFARVSAYYDGVLVEEDRYEVYKPSDDVEGDGWQDIELLDAYVSYDDDVAGMPYTVRLGKQVVNWGEATLAFGLNNGFNALNVGAFVRPGAEVKEALLPVNMVYGSIAPTQNISVEAYAQLDFEPLRFPAGGTPFAGSDLTNPADNANRGWISGGIYSGRKFNCDVTGTSQSTQLVAGVVDGVFDYTGDNNLDVATSGYCDTTKIDYRETNSGLERIDYNAGAGFDVFNPDPEDDEAYGLAVRWYAENLNSTEFGFYYNKYNSRIPYTSFDSNGPVASWATYGVNSSASGRLLNPTGCFYGYQPGKGVNALAASQDDPSAAIASFNTALDGNTDLMYSDAVFASEFAAVSAGLAPEFLATPVIAQLYAAGLQKYGHIIDDDPETKNMMISDPNGIAAAMVQNVDGAWVLSGNDSYEDGEEGVSYIDYHRTICAAHLMGIGEAKAGGTPAYLSNANPDLPGVVATTGVVAPSIGYDVDLVWKYPEVESIGLSAATNVLGTTLLVDLAYKPDMPLYMEGNEAIIGALIGSCAFLGVPGLGVPILENFGKTVTAEQNIVCSTEKQNVEGWFEEDIVQYNIGTTSLLTQSNPLVSLIGADSLLVLTEFNGIHFEDAEDHDNAKNGSGLTAQQDEIVSANRCAGEGGTDIAAGGTFNIDPLPTKVCRATKSSMEAAVILGATYSNVFGTAYTLSPRIVHRRGLFGRMPSPVGSAVNGAHSTNIGVTASYQNGFSLELAYTSYSAPAQYDANGDRDFMSINAKYGF